MAQLVLTNLVCSQLHYSLLWQMASIVAADTAVVGTTPVVNGTAPVDSVALVGHLRFALSEIKWMKNRLERTENALLAAADVIRPPPASSIIASPTVSLTASPIMASPVASGHLSTASQMAAPAASPDSSPEPPVKLRRLNCALFHTSDSNDCGGKAPGGFGSDVSNAD